MPFTAGEKSRENPVTAPYGRMNTSLDLCIFRGFYSFRDGAKSHHMVNSS